MSYPVEIDAAIIKIGNGATPEVFAIACGLENVTINETVNTTDRFRRDCAKPGQIPSRGIRVNGLQWDITGSGVANADQFTAFKAALGQHKNYQIDAIRYDGTDAGELLGTFTGQGVMTAKNLNLQTSGESSAEVTIAGENDLVWDPA
jgi:hypothetical protein